MLRLPDAILNGDLQIQVPQTRRQPGRLQLKILGATGHNLKGFDLSIPLGIMVAITGVSGSGKSTLVHDVIYNGFAEQKRQSAGAVAEGSYTRLEGGELLDEVILVDQSPIGRTPRSNPVTYIKAFDAIRELFASLPEAQKHGYTAGHFSFNIPGGRCENLPGRRHRHGGDAVPGRRRIGLRGVQGHALQTGDSGGSLSWQATSTTC